MINGAETSGWVQSSVKLRPCMLVRVVNYDYKHKKEKGLELEEKYEYGHLKKTQKFWKFCGAP